MPVSLADIVSALPSDETWGPPTSTDALVDGVPYAPYSKADKLGRMADWNTEGKDRDGRGGRQQYNRNYRGMFLTYTADTFRATTDIPQTSRSMVPAHLLYSPFRLPKTNPHFPLSTILGHQPRHGASVAAALPSSEAVVVVPEISEEGEELFSGSEDEVASKTTTTILEEVGVDAAAGLEVGKTTINHSATGTLPST